MRKTVIFGFWGLLFPLSAFCQEFEALLKQSLYYFEQNELQKFEETYPRLYVEYLKANLPAYQEAVKAVDRQDTELAFSDINSLIDEDLFLDEIEYDKNFNMLHEKEEWHNLIQKINIINSIYNEKVRSELKEIQRKDQGIRLLYINTKNDSLKTAIHDYMKVVVDKDCAEKICSILDKYGWSGSGEIGSEANETLFLGIQHVDDLMVQKKYLPMLKDAVQSGKAEGWHLAFLTDRILMNQGKKQRYGTQKIVSNDPTKTYIIPLEYPDNIDDLRKELGLPPLAEDLAEEGIHWDLDEYKKNLPVIEKMYKERYEALESRSKK
jgi:hypothetical protein